MKKSAFLISKMDCPSEEQLIRMKLARIDQIKDLKYYLPERLLEVFHDQDVEQITSSIDDLKLDSTYRDSEEATLEVPSDPSIQIKALWINLDKSFNKVGKVLGLLMSGN